MLLVVISCCIFAAVAQDVNYTFDTKYIEVPVDHFSYTTNVTFKLRYLINDTFYVERGPIFFYTGNEGDISMFAQNTGFMFDIAPRFNALIVFAEHRYYGTSLPFGNLTFTSPKYLGYLSSGQALADFVDLINDLQETYLVEDQKNIPVPVVAFGGSYGGMLAAWLRMKYPSAIVGSIASSAPIWQFKDLTPCENFNLIITTVFEGQGGDTCSNTIKKSWQIIRSETKNDTGKVQLSKLWKLCTTLEKEEDVEQLINWLSEIYAALTEINYPYPTNFLTPIPAYPVREFCNRLNSYDCKDDLDVLKAIGTALEIYTNYTGSTKCNNIGQTSASLGESLWDFQACTEMIMPLCSTDADMFENSEWNFKGYSEDCFNRFSVRPRNELVPILEYGGKDIKYFSNIVFSNGLLDPWSGAGVLSNVTSSILSVVIPDAAHHLDLRASNPKDPESVKQARLFHIGQINKWLMDYYMANSRKRKHYGFNYV